MRTLLASLTTSPAVDLLPASFPSGSHLMVWCCINGSTCPTNTPQPKGQHVHTGLTAVCTCQA